MARLVMRGDDHAANPPYRRLAYLVGFARDLNKAQRDELTDRLRGVGGYFRSMTRHESISRLKYPTMDYLRNMHLSESDMILRIRSVRKFDYDDDTLHRWWMQVIFEIPAEIPFAHELLMKILQENMKIKKIYWGNLLLVYIYTKN